MQAQARNFFAPGRSPSIQTCGPSSGKRKGKAQPEASADDMEVDAEVPVGLGAAARARNPPPVPPVGSLPIGTAPNRYRFLSQIWDLVFNQGGEVPTSMGTTSNVQAFLDDEESIRVAQEEAHEHYSAWMAAADAQGMSEIGWRPDISRDPRHFTDEQWTMSKGNLSPAAESIPPQPDISAKCGIAQPYH